MSNLLRFILDDGASFVACCDDRRWPVDPNRLETSVETASSVMLVSDTEVHTIRPERLEAILPVEAWCQIPIESLVCRFALIV